MKIKFLLALCLAGASFGVFGQTHVEAVEYYNAGQYNNALELLERNFNNAGTDKAVANYYLGQLSILQKDMAKAKEYFDAGIAANPDYPYNYIGLGSLDLKNGNVKSAAEDFKKAEKLNKKDAAVEVAIARAYYESSPEGGVTYAKEIAKYLKNARKRNMLEPTIFILEGDMQMDAGDRDAAATSYDMAASYNKTDAAAYLKYANLFRKLNPQFSIQKLQELLSNNPNSALGQRELAKIYAEMNDYKNAALQYGNYVNNPNHFKSDEDQYAFLLFYNSEFKKGYDYATKLLKENPDNFTAERFQFMNAAQLPEMRDQLLPMAELLYTNHKKNPKKNIFAPIDYNLIINEFTNAKKYDEAMALLDEAMKEDPSNIEYLKMKAAIPTDQGDYAKAAEIYEQYLQKVGSKASASDILQTARLYFYAGLSDQKKGGTEAANLFNNAFKFAEQASKVSPEWYWPYRVMGDATLLTAPKAEASAKAMPFYQKALELCDPQKNAADYQEIQQIIGSK